MTEAKNPEEHSSAPAADGSADAAKAEAKTDAKTDATAGPRCRSCGTPLAADQRWCLECGAARTPSRWHSGRRSLALTAALTIGLLGVAVAASYAAIVDESPISPTATVAAVAPPVVTPAPTTDTQATTPDYVAPTADSSTASTDTSAVDGLSSVDSSTYSSGSTGSTGSDTGAGSDTVVKPDPTKTTTTTKTTPTPPAPTAIKIKANALSTYDPDGNQQAPDDGDPAGALAASRSNAFTVLTAADQPKMDVGLAIDLGKGKGVGSIQFKTSTPGYKVEIYGSFQDSAPPTIDDSRWAFIKSRRNVGSGREVINLQDDTTKYKQILLWLTTPPKAGVPADLYSLKLYD